MVVVDSESTKDELVLDAIREVRDSVRDTKGSVEDLRAYFQDFKDKTFVPFQIDVVRDITAITATLKKNGNGKKNNEEDSGNNSSSVSSFVKSEGFKAFLLIIMVVLGGVCGGWVRELAIKFLTK